EHRGVLDPRIHLQHRAAEQLGPGHPAVHRRRVAHIAITPVESADLAPFEQQVEHMTRQFQAHRVGRLILCPSGSDATHTPLAKEMCRDRSTRTHHGSVYTKWPTAPERRRQVPAKSYGNPLSHKRLYR